MLRCLQFHVHVRFSGRSGPVAFSLAVLWIRLPDQGPAQPCAIAGGVPDCPGWTGVEDLKYDGQEEGSEVCVK